MGSSGKIITREEMRRWVRAAEKEMFDKVNWNVYVVCQVERISLKRLQYKDPNFSIFNRCSTRDVLQKRQEGLKISGRWLLCLWTAACQPTVLHSADDPQAWPRICQDQLSRLQHIWPTPTNQRVGEASWLHMVTEISQQHWDQCDSGVNLAEKSYMLWTEFK